MNQYLLEQYKNLGLSEKVIEFGEKIEAELKGRRSPNPFLCRRRFSGRRRGEGCIEMHLHGTDGPYIVHE